MRINSYNTKGISFKRALTPAEKSEYSSVLSEAREVINGGGKSVLIVHDSCLPQAYTSDTGVGHLCSKTSSDFFDFAKNYMGINTVEVLPPGEIQLKHAAGFYNNYNGSALSLGTQQIDLELLTEPRFNSILSKEDFQEVVTANRLTQKEGLANYENVIGKNSSAETALKKAFKNFTENPGIDKKAYESYKAANNDWLEPKAVYSVLKEENGGKNWAEWTSEIDRNLYDGNNPNAPLRLTEIKKSHADDIEFYKFKQFLAEEHLKTGKQNLNNKGIKLIGDCLIGFSDDETWAYKKAFKPGCFVGQENWKIPALDYSTILDKNSEAQKLLRRKVGLFAQRYDGIRLDVSWAYVKPKLSDGSKFDFKGNLLDIIDDTVKSVKGKDFDLRNIIHEFEADPKDFSILGENAEVLPHLKNRVKVITTAYMDDSYGSVDAMHKFGFSDDSFIIGVGNHDPQPLRQIAENMPDITSDTNALRRHTQERTLKRIMHLDDSSISTPSDFVKAKFSEPLTAKNQMVFYMDAFGRRERFDSQMYNNWKNYRYRIPQGFEKAYLNAVEEGFGYNPMDSYARIFKMKGYDTDPLKRPLYLKILKFRDIITEKTQSAVNTVKSNTSLLKKQKLQNIGVAVFIIALISTVISAVDKDLKKTEAGK